MFEWHFHDPWFLILALVAPWAYAWSKRPAGIMVFSSQQLVDHLPRTWRLRWRNLPAWMIGLSTIFLALGLARPRSPDAETRVRNEGIAMMMVVDRSGSMEARDLVAGDVSVNRLEVVKNVLRDFVLGSDAAGTQGRSDDLIGLIAFAGFADSYCPLTTDHPNLVRMVEQLEIAHQQADNGTALGDALALSVERLRNSEAVSKVVVLLTDGVNNAGVSTPEQSAELARTYGVKVYCIGAGTDGYAPVPVRFGPDPNSIVLRRERVTIDEATLEKVAELTGGRYFRATDADALANIYAQIDQLERSEITETRYLQYTEHYAAFLLPSVIMIMASLVARQSAFRAIG